MTDVLSSAKDRGFDATAMGPLRPSLVRSSSKAPSAEVNPEAEADADADADARARERAAELELMRAVASKDRKAETELARLIIGPVRSRTRVLTRTGADADDAAQAAMVEILKSAGSFRGEGPLIAWCERITIRTTMRQQRKQARRGAAIDDAVNPDDVSATAPDPALAEAIPGGEVRRYLLELSDDRRCALVLRHVLGHSVDEIAEQTGVSPNTVKDRLRMARKQVRQSIRQREVIAAVKGRLP